MNNNITKYSSKRDSANSTIKAAADKWPTTFAARTQIKNFTGGLYSHGTIANLDSEGKGPYGAFSIGRHVVYPVIFFCDLLSSKISID